MIKPLSVDAKRLQIISIACAIFTGLLYVFSFPPWNLSPLLLVTFIPLLWATDSIQNKYLPWITQATICIFGFSWIAYSVQRYGGVPAPFHYSVLLLFSLVGQLQIPIYFWARPKVQNWSKKRSSSSTLLAALLAFVYVGIESTIPKLFQDTLGHAYYPLEWTRQFSEVGGIYSLTWATMFINEILFSAFTKNSISWTGVLKKCLPVMAIILAIQAFGYFRVEQIKAVLNNIDPVNTPHLRASVIQANIGDFVKVASEQGSTTASRQVMQQYLELSESAKQASPDLIVWPETAYPFIFGQPDRAIEQIAEQQLVDFSKTFNGTLAFGGYDRQPVRSHLQSPEQSTVQSTETEDFNSIFFLQNAELKQPTYHKSVLLAFGETLPGADWFPSWFQQVKKLLPMMGFFGRGPGAQVNPIPNLTGTTFLAAPSICYEGLIPYLSDDATQLNADFYLNVTNDSWFGPFGEPDLHLALTTFRSVENRKYFLRSTNTGYSALIDPTGTVERKTKIFEPEILTVEIPIIQNIKPLPSALRSIVPTFSKGLCLLFIVLYFVRRKKWNTV